MTEDKRTTFFWDIYKNCKIVAMAIYDPDDRKWIPKAYTYWKRGNDKISGTLVESKRFESHWGAENHALFLAYKWCDEHVVDAIRHGFTITGNFRNLPPRKS
jgi:hypothetical protein